MAGRSPPARVARVGWQERARLRRWPEDACECEQPEPLPVSYEDVGIDLGITHFAALSNGEFLESPRCYRKAEKKLKKLQEALARKKRGSHRRKRAVKAIAKAHRKVRNQRRDFVHKASRKLVNRYQVIVLAACRREAKACLSSFA